MCERRWDPHSSGLEAIAGSGRPGGTAENDSLVTELEHRSNVARAGALTPDDAVTDPNEPLGEVPGAPPFASGGLRVRHRGHTRIELAFATMFVPSNDAFFAPGPGGIRLFDGDSPVDGSVTDDVFLRDAGTEPNEDPSSDGPDQAPRQGLELETPDEGPGRDGVVRELRPLERSVAVAVPQRDRPQRPGRWVERRSGTVVRWRKSSMSSAVQAPRTSVMPGRSGGRAKKLQRRVVGAALGAWLARRGTPLPGQPYAGRNARTVSRSPDSASTSTRPRSVKTRFQSR